MPGDSWGRITHSFVAIYNEELCIEAIKKSLECDYETAAEDFYFNTVGAWAGEGTPTFTSSHHDD